LRGEGWREAAEVLIQGQKAGGEAQFADCSEMLFGGAEGTDDPSEGEGLERCGEGRGWFQSVGENGGGGQAGEVSSIHPDHYTSCGKSRSCIRVRL
jgi:hypothetical protein